MKKKLLIICLFCIMMTICMSACSSNISEKKEVAIKEEAENNIGIELIDQHVIDSSSEYWNTAFKIKNNTGESINTISLIINELDENGDIINSTSPQVPTIVEPGQSITINAIHKNTKELKSVQATNVSYYTGVDSQTGYHKGYIGKTEQLALQ